VTHRRIGVIETRARSRTRDDDASEARIELVDDMPSVERGARDGVCDELDRAKGCAFRPVGPPCVCHSSDMWNAFGIFKV